MILKPKMHDRNYVFVCVSMGVVCVCLCCPGAGRLITMHILKHSKLQDYKLFSSSYTFLNFMQWSSFLIKRKLMLNMVKAQRENSYRNYKAYKNETSLVYFYAFSKTSSLSSKEPGERPCKSLLFLHRQALAVAS